MYVQRSYRADRPQLKRVLGQDTATVAAAVQRTKNVHIFILLNVLMLYMLNNKTLIKHITYD